MIAEIRLSWALSRDVLQYATQKHQWARQALSFHKITQAEVMYYYAKVHIGMPELLSNGRDAIGIHDHVSYLSPKDSEMTELFKIVLLACHFQ